MFDKTPRQYKECSAEDTIARITTILERLDLMPRESYYSNPYPQIYSMRVELEKEKGSFGTNGKGRTREYCLASGFAEFAERLQNGLYVKYSRTMASRLKERHGFYYCPEERYLSEEEFRRLPEPIIEDFIRYTGESKSHFIASYFERLRVNNIPGIVSLPFYDTLNDTEIFLPLNLLYLTMGSNGMAAGNTNAEAIFQALCEVMERWGAAEIFYKQMTPPTVPDEFLKQFAEEYRIIRNIEKSGKYKVTVKDFSVNKRIPALGIIIENRELNKYKLNVGSETSFQIALSRVLTEVYQGIKDEKTFDEVLQDIPREIPGYFTADDEESTFERYRIFCLFTKDNSGVFPPGLFGPGEDYPFDPSVFTTQDSFEKEVKTLVKFVHKMGYNVYIRDVGYLGFPSVYVYIPELSALGRKNAPIAVKTDTFDMIELDKIEPLYFDFENQPEKVKRKIAHTFGNITSNPGIYDLFNITLPDKSPLKQVELPFFLTLVWYNLGEVEKAGEAFKRFLESQDDHHPYYDVVGKYLDLKKQGYNGNELVDKMPAEVGENQKDLVQEVIADMSDPGKVFQFIKFPRCPNCTDCTLQEDCLTARRVDISNKLYPEKKDNIIDQKSLSWIVDV
jgi:YcaO-like protein with predicted kinase domain